MSMKESVGFGAALFAVIGFAVIGFLSIQLHKGRLGLSRSRHCATVANSCHEFCFPHRGAVHHRVCAAMTIFKGVSPIR